MSETNAVAEVNIAEVEDVKAEAEVDTPGEDVLDIIEPQVDPRTVSLSYGGAERVYTQKPLSYFKKMEFFGVVGKALDVAIADGAEVNALLGGGTMTLSDLSAEDFGGLGAFVNLAARVAGEAPDFLKDCYIIWLNVPRAERAWAKEALDEISDDEGEAIIQTFIDQNWDAIESFFTVRVPALLKRVQARRKKD